ncbi:hypothetical protein [uncultured Variovorax sp.]|uniref:hypothetical protein n=1 Tax=uncultured Variovorax sp. TaxID=114708 RepID=UPI00260F34FB|nr:hypothetical protein [uncultured Variovorax sp.]
MAKSKAEKAKAREKRKKDARRREVMRRASSKTIRNAIQSVFDGTATASDLARVLNAESRPPPAHSFDDELASQVNELRKEVDRYLFAFIGAMESDCRAWTMIPGILVGGLPGESGDPPGAIGEFDSEPYPLAFGYAGNLTFEPVEDYLNDCPEALAATWCITTKFEEMIDGLLCIALSGNRNGARAVHVIRDGRWVRLHGVSTVERFFVGSLNEVIEQHHPDGVLLATAARIETLLRGKTTLDDALGEIEGVPDGELQERMKPHLEHLRRGLFGYHDDLMSLVDHIGSSNQASEAAIQLLQQLLHSSKATADEETRRAQDARRELALLKTKIATLTREDRKETPEASLAKQPEHHGPARPLRERLSEIFK